LVKNQCISKISTKKYLKYYRTA